MGFLCVAQTKFRLMVLLAQFLGLQVCATIPGLVSLGYLPPSSTQPHPHSPSCLDDDSSSKVLPCIHSCLLSLFSSYTLYRKASKSRIELRIDQTL